MNSANKELYVGIGMLGLALAGWFIAIPAGIDLPASVEIRALSPDFWPHAVMILLGVCGIIVAVQAYFDTLRADANDETAATGGGETADEIGGQAQVEFDPIQRTLRVIAALVGLFCVYFAIPQIGIIAAGVLIILVSTFALGERRLKYTVPLAAILPISLYMFFVHVANIPMPLGVFEALR